MDATRENVEKVLTDATRENVEKVLTERGYKKTDTFDGQHDDLFWDQWEQYGHTTVLVRNDRDSETVKIFEEVPEGEHMDCWLKGEPFLD
jgi:hypothetical protein